MQKVFITGSSGFVGKHLIELLSPDYQILGLTFDDYNESILNTSFVKGDLQNSEFLDKIISENKPDIIFHLAAIAKTWDETPNDLFGINFLGTANIYNSVIKLKTQSDYNPKIVYISSAEVYGKALHPESISEEEYLNPVSFYGTSKAAADRLSYQVSQSHKLNTLVIRPFNHTGPGQQKGFFVPDMASQIAQLEKDQQSEISVGNLGSIRDFLDVRDIVRAYKLIAEAETTPGETFNIASGKGIKMSAVLDILIKLSKQQITIKEDPKRLRPSDTPVYVGDSSKLQRRINWEPSISLEKTLEDTLNYWRDMLD